MRHWKFDKFELNLQTFELLENGSKVEIGKRSFDLLHYLIMNRHRVVPSKELQATVWESAALSPSAIPTCLLELRKILGDAEQPFRVIRNVRGRGYQFVAEVASPDRLDYFTRLSDFDPLFVGRDSEMRVLETALENVETTSSRQMVLIQGHAGIGKTRLLQEFLRHASDRVPSFVVRCPEIEGPPPYAPWRRLLRKLEAAFSRERILAAVSQVSAASPSPRNMPATLEAVFWGQSDNRFSIFNTWSRILASLSRDEPILIAFEDLHRTDIDSIDLLRWVADDLENAPLMLVASTRNISPQASVVLEEGSLATHLEGTVIDLPPLNKTSIESIVSDAADCAKPLAAALHELTAGNPFYIQRVLQIVDLNAAPNDIDSIIAELPISDVDILSYSMQGLQPETLRALETAAVIGQTFPIALSAQISKLSTAQFLDLIEPARIAGLISETHTDPEEMQFSHMILRDALYSSLAMRDRKTTHAAIANHMIRAQSKSPSDSVGSIADHLEQALPIAPIALASEYTWKAGKQHLAKLAFREARAHLLKASDFIDRNVLASPEQRCGVLFDLAEAELYAGDREAARIALFEAASIARAARLACLLAECAIRMSPDFLTIEVGPFDPDLANLLLEALDELPKDEISLRAQAMARLSLALSWSGSREQSSQYALRALSLARKSQDTAALGLSLAARADWLHGPDRVDERLDVTRELRNVVRRLRDRPAIIMQHIRQIAVLLDYGDIQSVDTEIEACASTIREMNVPQYSWYPIAFRAMRSIMRGRLSDGDELGTKYLAIGKRTNDGNVAASRACQLCMTEIERDRGKAALPFAREFVTRYPEVRAWSAGLGLLYLNAGQTRQAIDILEMFDDDGIRSVFRETGGCASVAFLAEIAISANDTPRIAQLYDLCSPVGDRSATLGFGMGYFGCFSRYAGLLAIALGLDSEAVEHLRAAVATERHRGATTWRVHAELDLARAIARESGSTHEAKAVVESAFAALKSSELLRAKRRYREVARELA